MINLTLEAIMDLYRARGNAWYGEEAVSQLAHALQCAALAERAGASPHLVTACLLHDVGHLLAERDKTPSGGSDDRHEHVAANALAALFPSAVVEPVRLHVDAKRYLCCVEPDYFASLSPASVRSLELQGGAFDSKEADRFMARPFAADAVRLRRWDEAAKVPGRRTSTLDHFLGVLRLCVR